MLYWNISRHIRPSAYGNRKLIEDVLYCLEQLGVNDLKTGFPGDSVNLFLPRSLVAERRDTRGIGVGVASVSSLRAGSSHPTAAGDGGWERGDDRHRNVLGWPAGHFTVMMSLILANSPCLMPRTFMISSIVLKGLASMIAWALTGPMPGSMSSSCMAAELMLTF